MDKTKPVATTTRVLATAFPDTIYVRYEDDDEGGFFMASGDATAAVEGELVAVYLLHAVKTKTVVHGLKD